MKIKENRESNEVELSKIELYSKRLTRLLLAAPPSVQLSVAISSIVGPFMTLGPFVERAFQAWQSFSIWFRSTIESILSISVSPILWPNIFLVLLSLPLIIGVLLKFIRGRIEWYHWRENYRQNAISIILITILIHLYYYSVSPETYHELVQSNDPFSTLFMITSLAKMMWIGFLVIIISMKNNYYAERIFVYATSLVGILLLIDGVLGLLSLQGASKAEAQREIAVQLYNEGAFPEEYLHQYFVISIQYEYSVYTSQLSKLVYFSYFFVCVFVPRRIIDISILVASLSVIFLGFALLNSLLEAGAI